MNLRGDFLKDLQVFPLEEVLLGKHPNQVSGLGLADVTGPSVFGHQPQTHRLVTRGHTGRLQMKLIVSS
jgi:hypothetical protein